MTEIYEFMNTDTKDGKTVSFGLDENGNLYIDKNRVVTEQKLKLDLWINLAALLGGIGAFLQGLIAVIDFICK